jgi:cell division protein FtsB
VVSGRDRTRQEWERVTAGRRFSAEEPDRPVIMRRRVPARADEHRRGGSGRVFVLGVLVIGFTIAYAYPLRVYLNQQAEIAQLEEATRAQRERIQELADEVARWNDEEYIKLQARERFHLVEVGERTYVVGIDQTEDEQAGDATPPAWYEQVWTSVQSADDPPTTAP